MLVEPTWHQQHPKRGLQDKQSKRPTGPHCAKRPGIVKQGPAKFLSLSRARVRTPDGQDAIESRPQEDGLRVESARVTSMRARSASKVRVVDMEIRLLRARKYSMLSKSSSRSFVQGIYKLRR